MSKRLFIERLESRELLAADLMITEFMASNGTTLEDGEGASSDWIEIYNNGDEAADLFGYSLTDDYNDLNKWSFTSSEILEPGQFLVVFASGNDQPDSAGNWHTNFALSASGEYLALVDPVGTILTEYGAGGTEYPQQVADVSYGLAFNDGHQIVVSPESSATYLVPSNSSVDSVWMDTSFDDSSWSTGTASLGYETSGSNYTTAGLLDTVLPSGTTTAYVRIPFTVTDTSLLLTTLQMKYEDGFAAYLNGTMIASANAPSILRYNSLSSGSHADAEAVIYVDYDITSYSTLLVEGENVLAIHMLNSSQWSSDLLASVQMIGSTGGPLDPAVIGVLEAPSPGTVNTNLRASDVVYSQTGGVFYDTFQLTLSNGGGTEVIRYTTDGSEPTATSTLYTGPLTIDSTIQIRARSFGVNGEVGSIHTESFTHLDAEMAAFTSNLPIVVLENFGEGTPGTGDFEDAVMSVYDVDETTGLASLANEATLSTLIGQHRRGRSTANNPKTNLRIEIRDENGEDKSVELLGMPSESDWILYAPYTFDRALVRNATFYELSRAMGNWASRVVFVEVYANFGEDRGSNPDLTEADYMGVYVLMESIKRDSNRVDIAELTSTQESGSEITGGYIISMDGIDSEIPSEAVWKTDRDIPTLGDSWLVQEDPDIYELTDAQVDYIRGYIQDFEDALYGPNSTDPELGYQAYFDVDASIDHHILRLLSKEPDSLRLSTFLVKDRDGKLSFGPVWDFDRSSGADSDSRSADPTGWFLPDVDFFESDWWGELFDDPNFAQKWVDRWQELRSGALSDESLYNTVYGLATPLAEAQVRNFETWSNVAPNGGEYADPGLTGWEAEVSHLTNWLIIRANWIDDQLTKIPSLQPESGNVEAGQLVTLTAAAGATIYYTTDGTDPRADGGGISQSAIEYTGPFTVTETTQINARAYGDLISSSDSESRYPSIERPAYAVDGNPTTKYLNYAGVNAGLIITPYSGASIVRSFTLTTGNDFETRDPSAWALYGTNDTITSEDNSAGTEENWVLIDEGTIDLPSTRRAVSDTVEVDNSTPYTSYKWVFTELKNDSGYMQIADVTMYAGSSGTGAEILSAGASTLAIHSVTFEGISPWSSMVSALYSVEVPADASSLRISEVHYHPAEPTAAELLLAPGTTNTDYEFIELVNTSQQTISLNGVQLSGGIAFDFTTGSVTSLAPGEAIVVVNNAKAFAARYGSEVTIGGVFDSNLSNGGEQIILTDSSGTVIHNFVYDDSAPWPTAADGDGPSMEAVDLFGDYASGSNWQASLSDGGSPGVVELLPGDFDHNGRVDADDYLVWKTGFGSTADLAADGNHDGLVNLADYVIWRNHLGAIYSAPESFAAAASLGAGESGTAATTSDDEPQLAALASVAAESTTPTSDASATAAADSTSQTRSSLSSNSAAGNSSEQLFVTPAYPIEVNKRVGGKSNSGVSIVAPMTDRSTQRPADDLVSLDRAFGDLERVESRLAVRPLVRQYPHDELPGSTEALDEALTPAFDLL